MGIEMKERYNLLQKVLKTSIREKLKVGFAFGRLKWNSISPPDPQLIVTYSPIPNYEWKFLSKLDNSKKPETLIKTLTEIAQAIFVHTIREWQKKKEYKSNLKTISSYADIKLLSSGEDKWHEIKITTASVSDSKAGQIINDLLKWFIKKKYNFEVINKKDLRQYFNYVLPIMNELQMNRFIKYKTTEDIQPRVSFSKIESYLMRRIKKEPHLIECKQCHQQVYVLRDKQEFCFNPSCRVLMVRKNRKPQVG
ncbi:MAG: hypothetical protein Q8P40_14220 [Nitrospirota bacterium]|nr:hypothetical protein [Nitrospirota bacterium]